MNIHPSAKIHPTAIIEEGARIGANTIVGPYSCVGAKVVLGSDIELVSHVALAGDLTIGDGTKVYPFASLGHAPQDKKYHGELSKTKIGKNCVIREYVTIQPGTSGDKMETLVGDDCLLMVSSHVAHDCVVGNHVIMANNATLGGHVVVEDHVIIGGLSAVQQFVRIGQHAIIGGMSGVEKDVIPYAMVIGERAHLNGLNLIGLRRRGFSNGTIQSISELYNNLFDPEYGDTFSLRVEKLQQNATEDTAAQVMIDFITKSSKRSFCQPK